MVDTTLHGTANVARSSLRVMRAQGHGSLIVVSSLLASIAAPTMGAYVTAKWGQLGLIRTLQMETRDMPDITVSAVSPGGVDTPIYYQAGTVVGSTGRPLLPGVFDTLVGPLLGRLGMAHDGAAPTDGNVFEPTPEGESTRGRWRAV